LAALVIADGSTPELIAHRGESYDAPENTLAAFQLAWERKVPAIELDVHLTRDGKLILCHDKDTKRTTGKKLAIQDSTLEELRKLDAGSWKGASWKDEKLPTLDEALATVPEGGRCFIEIKVGPEAVPAVVKSVKASKLKPKQLAIISFKAETIAESKRQLPEVEAYYLSSFKKDKATGAWTPTVEELIAEAKAIRADGLDLSFEGPLDRDSIRRIQDAGLKFYVWTIDDPKIARQYAAWGASGITTNRAEWMAEQLVAQ
jgi:glycerophosphoryl diester phosphodiesterase